MPEMSEIEFNNLINDLKNAFEKILPEKSSFECFFSLFFTPFFTKDFP